MTAHAKADTAPAPRAPDDDAEPRDNELAPLEILTRDGGAGDPPSVRIGDVAVRVRAPGARPDLVPRVARFVPIAPHVRALRAMLRDWAAGAHLLLIGNQGVGKNVLADRLLELLGAEREYTQLHRDTTVRALTATPTLAGGRVAWEDAPLVRAARAGRALVIDEADKAPREVVCVLKALVEDGELLMADGRRLLIGRGAGAGDAPPDDGAGGDAPPHLSAAAPSAPRAGDIVAARGFRLVVLANRPGWPFLGNDFFRECGDALAAHVVDNPDAASELALLRALAPRADARVLAALVGAFGRLRALADAGELSYPYSTRELTRVARHLDAFPDAPVADALEDVLAFDARDAKLAEGLRDVLRAHGLPPDPDAPVEDEPGLELERDSSPPPGDGAAARETALPLDELAVAGMKHVDDDKGDEDEHGEGAGEAETDCPRDRSSSPSADEDGDAQGQPDKLAEEGDEALDRSDDEEQRRQNNCAEDAAAAEIASDASAARYSAPSGIAAGDVITREVGDTAGAFEGGQRVCNSLLDDGHDALGSAQTERLTEELIRLTSSALDGHSARGDSDASEIMRTTPAVRSGRISSDSTGASMAVERINDVIESALRNNTAPGEDAPAGHETTAGGADCEDCCTPQGPQSPAPRRKFEIPEKERLSLEEEDAKLAALAGDSRALRVLRAAAAALANTAAKRGSSAPPVHPDDVISECETSPSPRQAAVVVDEYTALRAAALPHVARVRAALLARAPAEAERVWLRQRLHGELDDERLVDAAAGELNVFRRRGIDEHVDPRGPA